MTEHPAERLNRTRAQIRAIYLKRLDDLDEQIRAVVRERDEALDRAEAAYLDEMAGLRAEKRVNDD